MVPSRFLVPAVLAAAVLVVAPAQAAPPLPIEMGGARSPAGTAEGGRARDAARRRDRRAPRRSRGADAAERTKFVAERKRTTVNATGRRGGPDMIGFGRDLPAAQRTIALSSLAWTTFAGGERVARIEVCVGRREGPARRGADAARPTRTSRCASARPDRDTSLLGVPAASVVEATARFGEYWSPVVDGPRIAIELVARAGAKVDVGTLELARVSHLVVGAAHVGGGGGEDPERHRRLGQLQHQLQVRHAVRQRRGRAGGRDGQAGLHRARRRHRSLHRDDAERPAALRSRPTSSRPTTASSRRTRPSRSTSGGSSTRSPAATARSATTSSRPAARRSSRAARTGTGRSCA